MKIVLMIIFIICIILLPILFVQMFKTQKEFNEIMLEIIRGKK